MRRGAAVPGVAICAACSLVVLLVHSSTRTRVKETNVAHRSPAPQLLLLCTYTMSVLVDERYLRWARTAALWGAGAPAEPLGLRREFLGHGVKLNLLRERLRGLVDAGRGEDLVMYTDSHDVMFVGPLVEAAARFQRRGDARVLFAAGKACWPDVELAPLYPRVRTPYRYLNAGALIGHASTLLELTSLRAVRDHEDDQLYYSHAYLNTSVRERLQLRLDYGAEIFQCLVNVSDHVRVVSEPGAWSHVENSLTGSRPLVLHGNGPYKDALWPYEVALVHSWTKHPELAPRGAVPDTAREKELPELSELYGLTHDDDNAHCTDY